MDNTMMPDNTPILLLQSQWDDEFKIFQQQEQLLQNQGLDPDSYNAKIAELQTAANERYAAHTQKMQELQRVQQLADMNLIDRDQASKAAWAMVLPREVLAAGKDKDEQGTPFSMSTITGEAMVGSINAAAKSAFVAPWLGSNYYDTKKLTEAYKNWTALLGYENLNPARRAQVDHVWDEFMRVKGVKEANGVSAWNPDYPDVQAIRQRGVIGSAMAAPAGAPLQPTMTTSPFAADLRKQLDAKKAKQQPTTSVPAPAASPDRVKVQSPDGKIGTIPATQLDSALKAGYKKV